VRTLCLLTICLPLACIGGSSPKIATGGDGDVNQTSEVAGVKAELKAALNLIASLQADVAGYQQKQQQEQAANASAGDGGYAKTTQVAFYVGGGSLALYALERLLSHREKVKAAEQMAAEKKAMTDLLLKMLPLINTESRAA